MGILRISMTKAARLSMVAMTVLLIASIPSPATRINAPDLTGLWTARLRFGPDVRGTLRLVRSGSDWRADLSGYSVPARFTAGAISFALPDGKGTFRGRVRGGRIDGQWVQQITMAAGAAFSTPVILRPDGANQWKGEVRPLDDVFTAYLDLKRRPDGAYSTYLRNPERNIGRFIPVSRLELSGATVRLFGNRSGQPERVQAEGTYDSANAVMTLPINGATLDFTRDTDANSAYYPRGKSPERYRYSPPLQVGDGWPVATPEEVAISRTGLEKLVQMLIDMPMDSLGAPQFHGVLIGRHGKLVLEEYFHGYDRDTPHDLRSASKSWTAVLIGAAMQAGIPIRLDTPVYATMLGQVPPDLDAGKRAMTLEHLISMTAGFDCDERTPNAPGQEDIMQQQTEEPNWYRYTMNVRLISQPGEKIVYCSIEPNLAGGMLQKIAGEPLPELFDRLVAQPLQMSNYHLFLTPTGDAYGGGGHRFLPRDFLKLAQLMVNDGRWGNRQIMSKEWSRKSGAALRNLSSVQQYGYLWNSLEFPWNGKKVRGYFAGGNGGQVFMGIPDLDLVVAFTGGSYADNPATFYSSRQVIPNFVLPAINEERH